MRVYARRALGLRKGISIGVGLFIMLIGLVDAGFVTRIPDAARTTVPLQLGADGHPNGWPVLVFVLGALLTLALIVRKVSGAILISIVAMTLLAVVVEAVAKLPAGSWGLTTPKWPGNLALFLTPVATMVPSQAATPALLAVGFLILANSVREIDWADYTIAVPAFVTMVMMPFTYSITNGIGMGFIIFVVLRLAAGRGREVPVAMYVVSAVFLFYYLMPALGLT